MKFEDTKAACAISDAHGQYIAQLFAQQYQTALLRSGYKQEDLDILLEGPDNEQYTEVWSELFPRTLKDDSGQEYVFDNFTGDGNIWEIKKEEYDQLEWDEEGII